MANKSTTPAPVAKAPLPTPPSTFSEAQAKKAVDALYAHHNKDRKSKEDKVLIEKEEHVWLCVNTKVMPKQKSNKPIKIQLPNPPLPPPPATSVCLLTKSPQREYKDLLASPAHNIKFISRVIDVKKLAGKHKPYEARRQLLRDHEVFLCDERVVEKMPGLLGKMWFEAKKQPIAVNMKRKDLAGELSRAISSTYFHESLGTSSTIRIATAAHHTPAQILSNLLSAIPQVISRLQSRHLPADSADAPLVEGWDLITSIGIKTSGSVMLPIWSCKTSERWEVVEKLAGKRKVESDSEDESMEGSVGEEVLERVVKKLKASEKKGGEKKGEKKVAEKKTAAPVEVKPSKAKGKGKATAVPTEAPAASPKPKVSFSSTPLGPTSSTAPAAGAPKKVMAGKGKAPPAEKKKVSGGVKTSVKAGLVKTKGRK